MKPLFPWSTFIDIPLVYGTFLVGTIWILHFTYGRLLLYTLVNLAIDGIFAFGMSKFIERLQLIDIRMSTWQLYLLMVGSAGLLNLFQMWYANDEAELVIGSRRHASA
ncbi:hypothetical protein FHS18_003650 [Paenibacillus phyllosphaerae]|uniref:Uncharacterized protein n=1 Tax=Paenibacillus phyllosphaerae TaxID=274593 RepID=A0A7W5FNW4_9BACL|nr:hypothetical protein [Paenibacillus phyllosphaerae]MBB3111582.1 hypothetical protein [Paenibacillus phyllosphaerae]